PFVDHFSQRLSVPIGQADASVRLGLADLRRVRGAVDAVAVAEIDPHAAHRIFGAGGDGEGLLRLHALELELGRVMVGRILHDRTNGQRTAGGGPLLAAYRGRVKADQLSTAVQRANRALDLSTTTFATFASDGFFATFGTMILVPAVSNDAFELSRVNRPGSMWNFSASSSRGSG